MGPAFAFVHSLLLGPSTWAAVAARLEATGAAVTVPSLVDTVEGPPPIWPRIVGRIVDAIDQLPSQLPVVVVAHSNAGLIVPVIVDACRRRVLGCVFVDARLPWPVGPTPTASPSRRERLREMAVGGRLPPWTAWWDKDAVAALFPDQRTRREVSSEQPRLALSYYDQLVPVPEGWDARPCGYVVFGPPYDEAARDARERGWTVAEVAGRHLHQLVDPDAVAASILAMTEEWTGSGRLDGTDGGDDSRGEFGSDVLGWD